MALPELDAAQPEQFYLPKASLARYARFKAVVEGACLPLNADRLVEAEVLDGLFEELQCGEVLDGTQSQIDISASFTDASLLETCSFLRWLYQPDRAGPGEFDAAAAAGGLVGAARLAHKLDAHSLLEKIERHLQDTMPASSLDNVIVCLQLAEGCHMSGLVNACINRLGSDMAQCTSEWWANARPKLAACSCPSLIELLERLSLDLEQMQIDLQTQQFRWALEAMEFGDQRDRLQERYDCLEQKKADEMAKYRRLLAENTRLCARTDEQIKRIMGPGIC